MIVVCQGYFYFFPWLQNFVVAPNIWFLGIPAKFHGLTTRGFYLNTFDRLIPPLRMSYSLFPRLTHRCDYHEHDQNDKVSDNLPEIVS